jgi:hypothetical protein
MRIDTKDYTVSFDLLISTMALIEHRLTKLGEANLASLSEAVRLNVARCFLDIENQLDSL